MSRVGVPNSERGRWRCPVCTLVNSMDVEDFCPRCKEPVDNTRRSKLRIRSRAPGAPSCAANSKSGARRSAIGAEAGGHKSAGQATAARRTSQKDQSVLKPLPRNQPKPATEIRTLPKPKRRSQPTVSKGATVRTLNDKAKSSSKLAQNRENAAKNGKNRADFGAIATKTRRASISSKATGPSSGSGSVTGASKRGSKPASTFGAGPSRATSASGSGSKPAGARSSGSGARRTTKPSKWTQQQKARSEKHLGYKASKSNVAKMVTSKLNHDTAAYRGKFEKPDDGKKVSNVATMSDLTSKQGFQTSINAKGKLKTNPKQAYTTSIKNGKVVKVKKNMYDEKIVRPPAGYTAAGRDKNASSVISRLQKACSGEAVASLRHKGIRHQLQHKSIDGQKSSLAL